MRVTDIRTLNTTRIINDRKQYNFLLCLQHGIHWVVIIVFTVTIYCMVESNIIDIRVFMFLKFLESYTDSFKEVYDRWCASLDNRLVALDSDKQFFSNTY